MHNSQLSCKVSQNAVVECVYRSTPLKSFGFHVARIHSRRRFIFIDKHMKRKRKKTSKNTAQKIWPYVASQVCTKYLNHCQQDCLLI